MAKKYEEKEKATGVWQGQDVSFSRVWSGHRFTDEEVKRLLNSETISFEVMNRYNRVSEVTGKLAVQTYRGRFYVGFQTDSFQNVPVYRA